MTSNLEKIELILAHIKKVESNLQFVAKHLIKESDSHLELVLKLLQLSREHDVSKFDLYEFKHLSAEFVGTKKFKIALNLHHEKNPHHPEHFASIHNMPDEYIAEMVCDCFARGQEFGTNVLDWFANQGTKKYNFEMTDEIGKKIQYFISILTKNKF